MPYSSPAYSKGKIYLKYFSQKYPNSKSFIITLEKKREAICTLPVFLSTFTPHLEFYPDTVLF